MSPLEDTIDNKNEIPDEMSHNEEEENSTDNLPIQNPDAKRKMIIENVINSILPALKTGTGFRMTSVTEEINIKLIESNNSNCWIEPAEIILRRKI